MTDPTELGTISGNRSTSSTSEPMTRPHDKHPEQHDSVQDASATTGHALPSSAEGGLAIQDNPFRWLPMYMPLQENEIRLIDLQHSYEDHYALVKVSLQSLPSYTAVSHRWLEDEKDEISVNTELVLVSRNVVACLANLHDVRRDCDFVRIDTICINQSDLAERSTQVAAMGKIYSSAKIVTHGTRKKAYRDRGIRDIPEYDAIASTRLVLQGYRLVIDKRHKFRHQPDRIRLLYKILERHKDLRCSDVRDKVFGLLAIASIGARVGLRADYDKPVQELLLQVFFLGVRPTTSAHTVLWRVSFLQTLLGVPCYELRFQQWYMHNANKIRSLATGVSVPTLDGQQPHDDLPKIKVRGRLVGVVTDLGTTRGNDETPDEVKAWLELCKVDLQQQHLGVTMKRHHRALAPFTTLCLDQGSYAFRLVEDNADGRTSGVRSAVNDIAAHPSAHMRYPYSGMRMFVDNRGRVGLACPGVEAGDVLCNVIESNADSGLILVLRPTRFPYDVLGRALYGTRVHLPQDFFEARPAALVNPFFVSLSTLAVLAFSMDVQIPNPDGMSC